MDPLVYIIVLNFNGKEEHLPGCLGAIRRLSYARRRLIVVDNGSTDGSAEYVRDKFPEAEVIRHARNVGFAESNNRGMERALREGADYIALLNNDIEVEPGWLSALVDAAEADPSIGACATKLLHFGNREIIQGVGVRINRIALAWDYLNGRYDLPGLPVDPEVIAACGGALFVRASALRDAGLFDPAYYFYMEDVDLGMRIWNAGYRIVTAPAARAYHKFAATLGKDPRRKERFILRNRLWLMARHFPSRMLPQAFGNALLREWRAARDDLRSRDCRMITARASAVLASARRIPRLLAERRKATAATRERTWELVRQDLRPDRVRLPSTPSAGWEHASGAEITLAAPGARLGPGWYLMYDGGDREYRWFAREASLALAVPPRPEATLRITVGNDYARLKRVRLRVMADGEEIGNIAPEDGWHDYVFPFATAGRAAVTVTLRADDLYRAELTGLPTDLSFKARSVSVA